MIGALEQSRRRLGRVGVWFSALGSASAGSERVALSECEELGFSSLWIGETSTRKEAFAHSGILLAGSRDLLVGIGVANIWARDAVAMQSGALALAEAYPGRFILGLGVSHDGLVAARGHVYDRPLSTMRAYLDQMDAAVLDFPLPAEPLLRVLGAIRPQMLALAKERTDGAHTYLMPPVHTSFARDILGERPLLAVEQAFILDQSASSARKLARQLLGPALRLPNYRRALSDAGFGEGDLDGGGSDRLIDGLVAWGDCEAICARLCDHLEAGADHVAVQCLSVTLDSAASQLRHLALSPPFQLLLEHGGP